MKPKKPTNWRDFSVEILTRVHAIRDFRDRTLDFLYEIDTNQRRSLLIVAGSRISTGRLRRELGQLSTVVRSAVMKRLTVIATSDGRSLEPVLNQSGLTDADWDDFSAWLQERLSRRRRHRNPRRSLDVVFECLVNFWLYDKGPITIEGLRAVTGFSYPPVAKALDQLEPWLKRHSDRSVELASFPRDEWRRYLSVVERSGLARKYVAPPQIARSPEYLLRRVRRLHLPELAISGVAAAHHYHPDLDLAGMPRVDICLHARYGEFSVNFLKQIDPALKETSDPNEVPVLVVWPVFRADSMFQFDEENDHSWADPASCLLALHDAHLDAQAEELIHAFRPGAPLI